MTPLEYKQQRSMLFPRFVTPRTPDSSILFADVPSPEAEWLADWMDFHYTHSLRHKLYRLWIGRYTAWPIRVKEDSSSGIGTSFRAVCGCGAVSPYMADYDSW